MPGFISSTNCTQSATHVGLWSDQCTETSGTRRSPDASTCVW